MKLADSVMAGKTTEGSIKWQLCYDISARTWWMVSWQQPKLFFFFFLHSFSPFFFLLRNSFPTSSLEPLKKTKMFFVSFFETQFFNFTLSGFLMTVLFVFVSCQCHSLLSVGALRLMSLLFFSCRLNSGCQI